MDRERDAFYAEHFEDPCNRLRAVRSLLIDAIGLRSTGIHPSKVLMVSFGAASVGPEEMSHSPEDSVIFQHTRERFAACAAAIELDEAVKQLDPKYEAEVSRQIRAVRNAYAHGCLRPTWASAHRNTPDELPAQRNPKRFSEVTTEQVFRVDHGGLPQLLLWANLLLKVFEQTSESEGAV